MTVNSDFLSREVYIHCCKDKTLSYRRKGERIFNDVALPVFTVNSVEEAESLLIIVGRAQYEAHPDIPNKIWYKITLNGDLDHKRHLDVEDMDAVTEKLQIAYGRLQSLTRRE